MQLDKAALLVVALAAVNSTVFAAPDAIVVRGGDLRIRDIGSGLVFPDGSIQYKATVAGPTGAPGPAGPVNALKIGTVQTGTQAGATITGTAPNQVLNITLPQGAVGPQGAQGPPGPACQITLDSLCAAISAGGAQLPSFCMASSIASPVTDPATGLIWQKSDDNQKRNWYEATAYCNNLGLGTMGGTMWRLPTREELKALNYSTIYNQMLGTHYAQVGGEYIGSYWSSTSFDDTQAYHVFLRSNAGSEGYANKTYYTNLVRCVAGGGGASNVLHYTPNDLMGSWYWLKIENGGGGLWEFAKADIDTGGTAVLSQGLDSDGDLISGVSIPFVIAPDGTVNSPVLTSNNFHGAMTIDKQLIAGTMTPDTTVIPNTVGMPILVKVGGTYSQADLQGTWRSHTFLLQGTSMSSANNRWERGNVSINALGAAVSTGNQYSAGSAVAAAGDGAFTLSLNPQGLVTISTIPSFHGILSADKTLLVAVYTKNDGSRALSFFAKTTTTTPTYADLQGSWRANYLMLNTVKWGRAATAIDSAGNATMSEITQSDGARQNQSITFSGLAPGGVFGSSIESSNFSGVISLGKNLMIGTVTQDPIDNPSPSLFIWTRQYPAEF